MVYLLFTNANKRRCHESLVRKAMSTTGTRDKLFVFDWSVLPGLGRMFDISEIPTLVHDGLLGGNARKLRRFTTVNQVSEFIKPNQSESDEPRAG
jgi:hypothetical protein